MNVTRDLLRMFQQLLRGELSRAKRRRGSAPLLIAVLTVAVFAIGWFLDEPAAPLPGKGMELSCLVSDVHDGDTVTASCDNGQLKVRVFGIDAPEIGQQPWGEWSRDQLRTLIPGDNRLRFQVMDKDNYGRVVARLYAGDRDLGFDMVRQGFAVVYAQYNKSRAYQEAQAQAKRESLGVWSRAGAQQEPWQWRRLNPR